MTDAELLAQEIIRDQKWFDDLDRAMKDEHSLPNHNAIMAKNVLRLAKAVLGASPTSRDRRQPC